MKKKNSFKVFVTPMPCSCGGTLRPCKLDGEKDVSTELGIPAVVVGSFVLLTCDRCNGASLAGSMLEVLSDEATMLLLKLDRRLSGAEARFLRKAALGVGQEELAQLLGLTRVTVARWEGARSLSAPHDFELRSLVLGHLCKASRLGGKWHRRHDELVRLMSQVLESARTAEAPARPPPLRLAA